MCIDHKAWHSMDLLIAITGIYGKTLNRFLKKYLYVLTNYQLVIMNEITFLKTLKKLYFHVLILRTRSMTSSINMSNISSKLLFTEYLPITAYHRLYQMNFRFVV